MAVGLPLVVYLAQDALIFYRQPLPEARRVEIGRRFPAVRELFLQSNDGVRLHAWHVKAAGIAPLILYFGGNAEETSWMLEEVGNAPGASWLIVNYRGYGLSEGSPGEAVLVSDALQWFDYAMTLPGAEPKRTFAFGRSLGSGIAVALAAQRPVARLILVTPYDSLAAVAKRHYWYLPVDLLLKHRFDSIALAPALKQPLLCLVAERDEVIPPVHGERLFDAWGGEKRKILLQESGHNSTDAHPMFWTSIREFLAQKVN
ncbi:MAG: alpha/beta hydrolase [Betaproteobacteria bacterium]|nr:alpha/beta hydrolase [Betaproteobacteria bacterium]